jgi:hypothetical protein
MIQGVRDHVIMALLAVAISRLHVPQAHENFVNGVFEGVFH